MPAQLIAEVLLEVADASDVVARLAERRHAAETAHVAFAGDLRGDVLRLLHVVLNRRVGRWRSLWRRSRLRGGAFRGVRMRGLNDLHRHAHSAEGERGAERPCRVLFLQFPEALWLDFFDF